MGCNTTKLVDKFLHRVPYNVVNCMLVPDVKSYRKQKDVLT